MKNAVGLVGWKKIRRKITGWKMKEEKK